MKFSSRVAKKWHFPENICVLLYLNTTVLMGPLKHFIDLIFLFDQFSFLKHTYFLSCRENDSSKFSSKEI